MRVEDGTSSEEAKEEQVIVDAVDADVKDILLVREAEGEIEDGEGRESFVPSSIVSVRRERRASIWLTAGNRKA